ncbi:MAG: site-specific DNA-methyltransferase [Anaerolineales bacterium]
MPTLNWPGKRLDFPPPATLRIETIVGPAEQAAQNRLFWADNLALMSHLLTEYEGKIDLIYADPPFFTNRRYAARIGHGEDSRRPQTWRLAEGYDDDWEDLDEYLDFLYPRLALMHRLLAPHGTLYLHLDWHANAYARLLLDEIFGHEHLLNEIIWVYHGPSAIRRAFNRKHDTILVYVKGEQYTFNADAVRQPYHPSTHKTFASSPRAGFGKVPNLKRGKVPEDWWYFPVVARLHKERSGYPTQKPQALLERILLASSNPGDLVADFFCGSGTTAAVAARLGRRFLAADVTWRAVHVTRTRLIREGAAFTLEHQESFSPQWKPLDAEWVHIQDGQISLQTPFALDCWEIDEDWDGQIFHSHHQALRARHQAQAANALQVTPRGNVCIRAVSVEGECYQFVQRSSR